MSSSLKSHIASHAVAGAPSLAVRRRLVLALAAWPVAALASAGDPGPSPYAGLKRWGSGDFSRFGLTIYRATLWAGEAIAGEPQAQVDALIESKGLKQMNDSGALEAIVDEVLAANEKNVAEYRAGKEKAFNALVGQVMKASKGKANPGQVNEVLKARLG